MEIERTEKIEFQCSSTSKKLLPLQSPLLDLPIPVTELILERLPLSDYIRFGCVCTKWHSIQKQHRIHHSPSPPPMPKSFPWLINERKNELACYSPLEQKHFTLTIPKTKYRLIPPVYILSDLSLGWFFLVHKGHSEQISLFNPVTKSLIDLPPLMIDLSTKIKGVLSVSPVSLNCVVLILDYSHLKAFIYRRKQWMSLDIPNELDTNVYFGVDSVYCNGKFYCIVDGFFVIDFGFSTPVANELIMDCSQLPYEEYDQDQSLVESNGELLLVDITYDQSYSSLDVFKAEFSRMMWVELKTIGDRALFVTSKGSFSVSANDVGCNSNCVYFVDETHHFVKARGIWTVFDIGTKLWSGGPPFPCKDNGDKLAGCFEHWFLPSFDYNV